MALALAHPATPTIDRPAREGLDLHPAGLEKLGYPAIIAAKTGGDGGVVKTIDPIDAASRIHNDTYPAPGYAGKSAVGYPVKEAFVEVDDTVGLREAAVQGRWTACFLLDDTGTSARQCVFMSSATKMVATRWMECEAHVQAFQTDRARSDLDQSNLITTGAWRTVGRRRMAGPCFSCRKRNQRNRSRLSRRSGRSGRARGVRSHRAAEERLTGAERP